MSRRAVGLAALGVGAGILLAVLVTRRDELSDKAVSGEAGARESIPSPASPSRAESSAGDGIRKAVNGEQAELEAVAQPTGERLERSFFGRVRERDGGRPIERARVRFRRILSATKPSAVLRYVSPSGETATDAGGLFEVRFATEDNLRIRVDASGYAPALVQATEGHSAAEAAQEVFLARGAKLRVRVIDSGGLLVEGARVQLSVDPAAIVQPRSYSPPSATDSLAPSFDAQTDASGRCEIADIPADVIVAATLARAQGSPGVPMEALTFDAGETKEVEWRVDAGCELRGLVRDQHGQPVPHLDILLEPATAERPRVLQLHDADVTARARSDEVGRFLIADVSAGAWWLGPPAPAGAATVGQDVSAVATAVEILPGVQTQDVLVRVHRGATVSGQVLDPDGAPVAKAWVGATSENERVPVTAKSAADGSFEVGPLPSGRVEVVACASLTDPASDRLAPSDPVAAVVGDQGLVLRLKPGASIRGRLVDARTGKGVAGEVLLTGRAPLDALMMLGQTGKDGTFRFPSLEPGRYDLGARATGPLAGARSDVLLEAGVAIDDLVLTLEPGATLRTKYEGAHDFASFTVLRDGVPVATDAVVRGTSSDQAVPAGRLVVRIELRGVEGRRETEIDVLAGETRDFVITDREP